MGDLLGGTLAPLKGRCTNVSDLFWLRLTKEFCCLNLIKLQPFLNINDMRTKLHYDDSPIVVVAVCAVWRFCLPLLAVEVITQTPV